MKRIIGKLGLLCSAMLLALLLTGCLDSSVEDLMTLPQLPIQYTELSRQIDEMIKDGYEYASPLTGRNIQSVQMVDLDGDGYDEALAFFRQPSDEKQLKIFVFHRTEDSYAQLCTIESAGTGIDSVDYCDVTGDGKMELIVGWKISTDVQTVTVYSLQEEPTVLMRSGYTHFSIEDLDGNGIPSLLILRADSEGKSIAEFYSWHEEAMSVVYHCALSSTMAELSRGSIVSGRLTDNGTLGVFVTGVNNQGKAVTDILAYQDELGLVNVALDASTGQSKLVYGYRQISPQDINGDGQIELPEPAADSGETNQAGSVISWHHYYDNDYGEWEMEWAEDTYHCPNGGWYFELPNDWRGRTGGAVMESIGNENCVVLQLDGKNMIAFYSILGEQRDPRSFWGNRMILEQQTAVTYAAELLPDASRYGMNEEILRQHFHLITNFWQS